MASFQYEPIVLSKSKGSEIIKIYASFQRA